MTLVLITRRMWIPFLWAVAGLIAARRLEHLGDSVLNMVVTSLLQEVYPYLRVGPSTVSTMASIST